MSLSNYFSDTWLCTKTVRIVHFEHNRGHDNRQYSVKITFRRFGLFPLQKEWLLSCYSGAPGRGVVWYPFIPGYKPSADCLGTQEEASRALDIWVEYVDKLKQADREEQKKINDRGTAVSKYNSRNIFGSVQTKPGIPAGTV